MGTKKTLLFFFIFFLIAIPFYWFVVAFPVKEFNNFYTNASTTVGNLITQVYPKDLIVDIVGGKVSINKTTPYCVTLEKTSRVGIIFDEKANPANLLNSSNSTYSSLCNPVALVGSTFIVYPDGEQGASGATYKIQQIPTEVTYQITSDKIQKMAEKYVPKIRQVAKQIYFTLPFVLPIFLLPLILLCNLWYALIGWVIFKLTGMNKQITFGQAYAKTFFALFVWTVVDFVLLKFVVGGLLHPGFTFSLPLMNTIAVVIVTLLLERYYFTKKSEVSPAASKSDKK